MKTLLVGHYNDMWVCKCLVDGNYYFKRDFSVFSPLQHYRLYCAKNNNIRKK